MPPLRKAEEYSVIETLMAKPEIYLSELQHKLFQTLVHGQIPAPFYELFND